MPEEEKASWRALVDGLANRLKKVSTREVARLKLMERRQKVGETVDEFAQTLRGLVERAYPDSSLEMDLSGLALDANLRIDVKGQHEEMTKKFRDEQCRDRFRAGLLPEIRERVIFLKEAGSLTEAISQAKRVEELMNSIKEDAWRRTKEIEVKATLAEVNEVRANKNQENPVGREGQYWRNQNWRQDSYNRGNRGQRGNTVGWNRGPQNRWQNFNQFYRGNSNNNQRGQGWNRNPNMIEVPSFRARGARGRGNNFARGAYRVNEVSFPYICLLAIICVVLPNVEGQFQICPKIYSEGGGTIMDFPLDHNCTIPVEEAPELTKINIYVPIRLPKKFPIYRCHRWNVQICTESYLGVYQKEKDASIFFSKITKGECWKIWDTHLLERRGEKVWQTPTNWEKEYAIFGLKCKNVTGVTLEEGSATILDGRKLVTSWGDEFLVSKERDEAEGWTKTLEFDEILMWRIPDPTYWHTHFKIGLVNAELWPPRAIVVDEMQYSFIYHQNSTHPENLQGLPRNAIRMENDVFIEIIDKKLENKTRVKRQGGTGILKKNRKIFDYRTTPETTTQSVQTRETTIPATTLKEVRTSSPEIKTTTPLWRATPPAYTPSQITRKVNFEIKMSPKITRGTTEAPRIRNTTPGITQRKIMSTTRSMPVRSQTTQKPVMMTRTTPKKPSTTTMRPTTRIIPSTPKAIVRTRPPLRENTKIEKKFPKIQTTTEKSTEDRPSGLGKLRGTTEESTTTLVMKREVTKKPWMDPKDENHANSRLNYLGWKIEQKRVIEAREKWIADCHSRNSQLAIARALAREIPEQAARSLYNRDDITATLLNTQDGKIRWQINKCRQVKADSINWNHMIGQDCYEETPVIVNKNKYFLKPGGRDLKSEGTKINCLKRKKVNKSQNSNATEIEELNIINPFQTSPRINRQNPLIFNMGSIFESDQTRLNQNLQDLTKRLNRPELVFPEEEITEEEEIDGNNSTKGTVKAVIAKGNKVFQTVLEQGKVIITKSSEAIDKGKTFLEDPFGIKSTIKMIIAVIAGIALVIGLCVIYWKGRIYIAFMIRGIRLGSSIVNTMINLIRPRRRHITVSAVEKRQTPTAPLAEETLEEEAYILDYIPKVYQISLKRRCYINISLNGRKTRALFDTGADITYVSKKTAEACGMKISKGDFPQAQAANSTPICLIGSSNTVIEMGNFRAHFPILISENDGCPGGAIIGTDLMEEINRREEDHTIGLDFKKGEVKLGKITLPMVNAINFEWKPLAVQVLKTHILPPLSDSLVWGKINKGTGPEEQFITVESEHKYFPLRVGKCLVQPMARRIVPLRLLNFGNSEIEVHANSKLASLEPVGNEPKIETVIKKDNTCMSETEWEEFKEEVDRIPEEANWINKLPDEPLSAHGRPLVERISLEGTILSERGLLELRQILEINKEAFMEEDGKIGNFRGKTVHKIDLMDGARPLQNRPYRYPLHLQAEIERQIKTLLKQNIIRPSSSACASPIVLAKKSDGSYRFCVDYRRLNSITKKQTYFLPRIQDLLDSAMGKQIFSVFDMSAGFHQIKLAKGHEERSAFICHCGLFEYLRVPFGLSGAPTTFQKAMEEVRQACSRSFLVYLDDCILGSEDERSHLNDLGAFLKTIKEAGLKLKPEKCKVGQAEIRYLGHLISANGIRIDPKDLEPIMKLKKPNTLTELRSLIGMLSYFRKFTPNFAEVMGPIYDLTKKENTREWGEAHEEALNTMKELLTSAPVLAPPKLGKPFTVETDASITAIAGCLLQKGREDNLHPVAYFSRKLNKHEKRYAVVELEALAIVASLKNFRPYLEGAGKSTVITDNSALTSLFRRKDLEGRLAKYQISIMAYDVDIIYRPGNKNHFCDHLSRFIENDKQEVNLIKMEKKINVEEMRLAQNEDEEIQKIRKALDEKTENEKWREWEGIIWAKEKGELRILVPEKLKKRVMEDYHKDPLQGGHLGEKRTLEKIKRLMFWNKMTEDVGKYVKQCDECQRRKIIGLHQSKEPITPIEPASRPFQRIHVDLMGPVPKARSGYKYILMVVDSFSKMMIPIPLREQQAETVMNALLAHVITKFGVPECLVSDQGTQFMSTIFKDVGELFGIKLQTTTPYHQSANGQCERYNRTLADMIGTTTKGKNWPEVLPLLAFAYNTSLNMQIGETPFFVAHGWQARLPSENELNKGEKGNEDVSMYVQELRERVKEVHDRVKNKLDLNVERMKRQQKFTNSIEWKEGDLVLTKIEEKGSKFGNKFQGPYQIIRVEKPNLVLEDPESGLNKTVHVDKCKRYHREGNQRKSDEIEEESHERNTNPNNSAEFETPQINIIIFNKDKNKENCRLDKIINKSILMSSTQKLNSTDNEDVVELLRDDELELEHLNAHRWEIAQENWTPLNMTLSEKEILEEKKEKALERALERNRKNYMEHTENEIIRRKGEREKRHKLKNLMKKEREGSINLIRRNLNNVFRSGRAKELQEEARRNKEEKAWEKSSVWGYPAINDGKREEEKRKKIENQITMEMLLKYAKKNSKRVNQEGEEDFIEKGMVQLKRGDNTYDDLVNEIMKEPGLLNSLRKEVEEEWEWKMRKNWTRKPEGSRMGGRGREEYRGFGRENRREYEVSPIRNVRNEISPIRKPIEAEKIGLEIRGEKKRKLMEELKRLEEEERREEERKRREEEKKRIEEEKKRKEGEEKKKLGELEDEDKHFEFGRKLLKMQGKAHNLYQDLRGLRKEWEEKLEGQERAKWEKQKAGKEDQQE
ncbi:hypothetical protein ACQ4LE_007495 [Meloidogyne hapla]